VKFTRRVSLKRLVSRVAVGISLQPVKSDVTQVEQLMYSLSDGGGGPVSKKVLQRYRDYLKIGWREGRSPHPLFDEVWYADRYPDVRAAGFPGLVHYLRFGWREGRSPHPLFDEVWYADRYPDVRAAGFPGLVHYLRFGWREGRSPHPSIPDARLLELR
jgi:hypothetical protein